MVLALSLNLLHSTRMGMMDRICSEAKAVMTMLEQLLGSFGSTSTWRVDLGLMTILGVNLVAGLSFF